MACAVGRHLFSLDDNSTQQIIDRLERFRDAYEPFHGYACVCICVFGILTNFINVIVLTKRQMRTSVNVLLTGIAICDMGTMASYLVYIIHFVFAMHQCNPHLYSYGWMLFLFCHIIFSVALHTTGLWLAVVMAFVRSVTLRRAMAGSKWLKAKHTWKICVAVYTCVFLLCIPSAFGNSITEYPAYFNETCDKSEGGRQLASAYERRYLSYTVDIEESRCLIFTVTLWLSGTLFKIIPCLLLAILIISLLWTIKKAERRRRALFQHNSVNPAGQQQGRGAQSGRLARSDRTSTMLVVILGLFLLTELPQGAISILSGIYVMDMRQFVYPNVGDVLDLLSLINSSVNFVLYCAMSSKYRQVFWQVVLPRNVYVGWVVRPRSGHRQTRDGPAITRPTETRRTTRPELHMLVTIANSAKTVERKRSEPETTVMDLYKGSDDDDAESSVESESGQSGSMETIRPRGFSLLGSFRRKKGTNSGLRRQALRRAAVLAATPAMVAPGDDYGVEEGQIREEKMEEECKEVVVLSAGPSEPIQLPDLPAKRRRWHISCSCLCKCACKSGGMPDNGEPRKPLTEGDAANAPDLVSTCQGHARRSFCPAMPLWHRQKRDCVVV